MLERFHNTGRFEVSEIVDPGFTKKGYVIKGFHVYQGNCLEYLKGLILSIFGKAIRYTEIDDQTGQTFRCFVDSNSLKHYEARVMPKNYTFKPINGGYSLSDRFLALVTQVKQAYEELNKNDPEKWVPQIRTNLGVLGYHASETNLIDSFFKIARENTLVSFKDLQLANEILKNLHPFIKPRLNQSHLTFRVYSENDTRSGIKECDLGIEETLKAGCYFFTYKEDGIVKKTIGFRNDFFSKFNKVDNDEKKTMLEAFYTAVEEALQSYEIQ